MAARLIIKKNKPKVDYEPRSAHGRAVKKNKPKVDYEPRSAHGRAVNKAGPKIEPCGTPCEIPCKLEVSAPLLTYCSRSER